MHTVLRAFYLKDFEVLLVFDDGKIKIVDLQEELWGPVFEPLKNVDYFKKVKAKGGTIVWPNEADFCPDVLYKMGLEIRTQRKNIGPHRSLKSQNMNKRKSKKSSLHFQ